MGAMASQITSLTIVYSTVISGSDQRKHQSPASLAFVRRNHRWPVNSPHKWPVTRKMFPFDDAIMITIPHKLPIMWKASQDIVIRQQRFDMNKREKMNVKITPVVLLTCMCHFYTFVYSCWIIPHHIPTPRNRLIFMMGITGIVAFMYCDRPGLVGAFPLLSPHTNSGDGLISYYITDQMCTKNQ